MRKERTDGRNGVVESGTKKKLTIFYSNGYLLGCRLVLFSLDSHDS